MLISKRRTFVKQIASLLPTFMVANTIAQQRNPEKDDMKPVAEPFMGGFFKGNDYRTLPQPEKIAYLTGVWDGYMFSPALGGRAKNDQVLFDCLPNLVPDQLLAIVEKYMKEHPEKWGSSMNFIVFSALPKSCQDGVYQVD
jgi:hypothetical protein